MIHNTSNPLFFSDLRFPFDGLEEVLADTLRFECWDKNDPLDAIGWAAPLGKASMVLRQYRDNLMAGESVAETLQLTDAAHSGASAGQLYVLLKWEREDGLEFYPPIMLPPPAPLPAPKPQPKRKTNGMLVVHLSNAILAPDPRNEKKDGKRAAGANSTLRTYLLQVTLGSQRKNVWYIYKSLY